MRGRPGVLIIAQTTARADMLGRELGLDRPYLVGQRNLVGAGRGIAELAAVLIDDTAGEIPDRVLNDLRMPLDRTGGEIYRLRRVR